MLTINKISGNENSNELIEKFVKFLKIRKLSKDLKLSKSQKLAKSEKKLLKSEILLHFDIKKNKPSFLTLDARITINYF